MPGLWSLLNDNPELLRPYFRITSQAEEKALQRLKDRSLNRVTRDLAVRDTSLLGLLERDRWRGIGLLTLEDDISLGIDEHLFKHQELVYMVTEVKNGQVLKVFKDDRMVTLKDFLGKMPKDRVQEVCMDIKENLRKVVESLLLEGKVVADDFHVIADSNGWMKPGESSRIPIRRKRSGYSRRYSCLSSIWDVQMTMNS
ncbi:MAG: transposase [Dehalococcoidia bacterium]